MDKFQKRTVLTYEIIGVLFITVLGSLFHFIFELSGFNPIVGAFSAVNESVWEHLKLGFWPLIIFTVIEYWKIRDKTNNFFLAKAVAAFTIILIIPAIFYSYTSITCEAILVIDILSFIIAVIVGQFLSYKLLSFKQQNKTVELISIIALAVLAVLFVIFTFYPPHLSPFQDAVTGEYGILAHSPYLLAVATSICNIEKN
ncbi:MAG: hypothetical protein IAX21_05405 [Candidatus Bathyarchaeota archaeon]|nr:DUF6512 family protein [Candidatus Bathyarchaeum tardum]WGM89616.1 MAG: DUF6512 family protein [Candidatus Bathyarchaeum tardum]WNZ30282.1 MAG: hypothetical protein IAX21_05405 [Candidatus Bathyarchaeota archaeon]